MVRPAGRPVDAADRLRTPTTSATATSPRLLDRLRGAIRLRHYSIRTETSYVDGVRRFIHFHGTSHPLDRGVAEVTAFLTHLAVERSVAASTQNQSKSAWLFLPFIWTATASDILAKVTRAKAALAAVADKYRTGRRTALACCVALALTR